MKHTPFANLLHVAVKLLLAVSGAVAFALKSAAAAETRVLLWIALLVILTITQNLDQVRLLDLLFEPLLQAVVSLFAFFDSVNSHKVRGILGDPGQGIKPSLGRLFPFYGRQLVEIVLGIHA